MANQDAQIAKATQEVHKTRELLKKQVEELEDRMVAMQAQELTYPIFLTKINNLIKEMQGIANG